MFLSFREVIVLPSWKTCGGLPIPEKKGYLNEFENWGMRRTIEMAGTRPSYVGLRGTTNGIDPHPKRKWKWDTLGRGKLWVSYSFRDFPSQLEKSWPGKIELNPLAKHNVTKFGIATFCTLSKPSQEKTCLKLTISFLIMDLKQILSKH